jgi:hypothetical protein
VEKEVASNQSCPTNTFISAYNDLNLAELVVRQVLMDKMRSELNIQIPDVIETFASDTKSASGDSSATSIPLAKVHRIFLL